MMGKFSGTTYIPYTIDADQIGGVDVDGAMSPSPGDVLEYDGAKWTAAAPSGGVTSVGASAPVTSTGGATPTIGITDFSSVARGTVPASGGGTANFLRADGTWAAPGGGTPVTSVSGSAPISSSGGTTPTISLDNLGVTTVKIADNAVTLAKLATQADWTWLGNVSGGAAVPTATELVKKSTSDPTLVTDSSSGYFVGQRIVNTADSRVWDCVDSTASAAIWRRCGGYAQTLQADAGTVGLYRLNGDLTDSSGSGRSLTGAGVILYPGSLGNRKASVWQSGSASASRTDAAFNLSTDLCITIVGFMKTVGAIQTVIQYGPNGTSRVFFIDITAGTARTLYSWGFGTGAASLDTQQAILSDQWAVMHFVRTVSGGNTTLTVYANGSQVGTTTHNGSVPTSGSSTLYLCRNATSTTTQNLANGMLGGVRISTTVPSANQIRYEAQLYHPYPGICA